MLLVNAMLSNNNNNDLPAKYLNTISDINFSQHNNKSALINSVHTNSSYLNQRRVEAEANALSGLLIYHNIFENTNTHLATDVFSDSFHRTVFQAIMQCVAQCQPVTNESVANALIDAHVDKDYLLRLSDLFGSNISIGATLREIEGLVGSYTDTKEQQTGEVSPVPFDDLNLPELDPAELPSLLRDFCTALAEEIQVPVELTTGMTLASIAVAAQGKFTVGVRNDYAEPVNIYVLVPLEPGNRKSATVEACKRPLVEFEREAREAARESNRSTASERKTLEKAIESKRNRAGTASPETLRELLEEIKQLEGELPEVPPLPRLLCDDVTPEQLACLMSEQGGRMGLLEAEGGILDILGGRYTNGAPNLDLFLKAHEGTSVHVDRRNALSVRLEKPCLTIGLSPQPYALTDRQAARAFRSRGLDARFLYLLPKSMVGRRIMEPPAMPRTVQERYRQKVRSLLELPWAVDADGNNVAHRLRLSGEAYRLWVDFAEDVERELADGGGLELLKDWGGKLAGAAIRLAGLLHALEHDAPQSREIEAGTMRHALYLASIFSEHAKGAFQLMGSEPIHECAKAVLGWIRRKGAVSFTERDCFNDLRGRYQTMDELRPGLKVLVERLYIVEMATQRKPGKAGRKASQAYEVNPLTFTMEVRR